MAVVVMRTTRRLKTARDVGPPRFPRQGCRLLSGVLLFAVRTLRPLRWAGAVVRSTEAGAVPTVASPGHAA